ncbi:MAG: phosphatidate cytidylyltransferase, partial [Acidobacteria bacterium]|nr:phosphatidate cytidylyltransferase [Acidobacteriota bacterium]
MSRVLSGFALIVIFGACLWYLPTPALFAIAEIVLVAAFVELASLFEQAGVAVPRTASGTVACAMCAAIAWPGLRLEPVLIGGVLLLSIIALAAGPGPATIPRFGAGLVPALYLGLPLGSLVAVHRSFGRDAVLLLVATIVVSDTLQYYSGRLVGRHLLASSISPKKTIEGAVGGLVGGVTAITVAGEWWMPTASVLTLALVGGVLVAAGIAGDLFESLIKRSAGAKDSSRLIPGHGGVLDRIDALLFAAPV